jgi:hypothetical protein
MGFASEATNFCYKRYLNLHHRKKMFATTVLLHHRKCFYLKLFYGFCTISYVDLHHRKTFFVDKHFFCYNKVKKWESFFSTYKQLQVLDEVGHVSPWQGSRGAQHFPSMYTWVFLGPGQKKPDHKFLGPSLAWPNLQAYKSGPSPA